MTFYNNNDYQIILIGVLFINILSINNKYSLDRNNNIANINNHQVV